MSAQGLGAAAMRGLVALLVVAGAMAALSAPTVAAPLDRVRALLEGDITTLEGELFTLVVLAPDEPRAVLVQHLDLARFRTESDLSDTELGRLIAATPGQARRLLEPSGYFNAVVEVERTPPRAGERPTVTVRVDPGPPTQVEELRLLLQGAMLDAINEGDERTERRWKRLQRRWDLDEGSIFTQQAWSQSRTDLVNDLRSRAYPTASIAGSSARIDADRDRAKLFVAVDSGPLFRVGEVRVEGLHRTPASAAINVKPFDRGEVYDEQMLVDYQEMLTRVGLYDGIGIELDSDPAQAEHAAVILRLRERQFQEASPSIGFSTDTGGRVGLDYSHRRPFDRDWVFSTRLSLGQSERFLNFDLLSYPRENAHRLVFNVRADYLDAGGSITETQRVRAGRLQEQLRFTRFGYAELTRSEVTTANERRIDRATGLYFEWTRRDLNNRLFPTRGSIITLNGGGGRADDNDGDGGQFARGLARLTWYQPLGAGWFLQVRGEAAQVFAKDALGIPDALLFRAGGDDSVRGYGYQTLGPTRDGATVGGRKMATGTVEVMKRISPQLPDWFGAVFVDAGDAADQWEDIDAAIGIGVGVRWRSPVGPLRIDIAWGERERSLRLHLGVGVSF